ncbi:GGDEF domain-containing protein [Pseudoalteromonas rubra]|uniref:GGDEF domain-containing protein n=1 Tax=Pseudoalteromonas rubra TaxID=43658 RepID=A0A5S3WKU4_9GAMM|nr:GGDEF domain-containing protein [Pseudoalteromonas rubra]TMP28212.1 GGDEF domain-containing protein [Pseudoalteromonas rubra]TMP34914.1 GGDEF domain-containing protein [Pseudoalteromonas rubra]
MSNFVLETMDSLNSGEVIDSMTDIVACLNTSDSIQRFLLDIHCILQKVTYADNFYVVLFREDGSLTFPYFHDVKDDINPSDLEALSLDEIAHSLTAYALQSQSVCNFKREQLHQLVAQGRLKILGTVPKQWLCFPLVNRNNFMGAFIIQSYRREDEYSGVIVDVLYTISHVISSALDAFNNQQALVEANKVLQNYQSELESKVAERTQELESSLSELQKEIRTREALQQRLEHEALHDTLTGLTNRKFLFRELNNLAERSKRGPVSVHILYLDLDDFKPINDNFGHHSGDIVLQDVAQRIKRDLRSYDVLCRLGGDEFVVVLSEPLEKPVLMQICSRLITCISSPIQLEGGQQVQCGCSIGIANNTGVFSAEALLKCADSALYSAKELGKNQAYFYDESEIR